MRHRCVEGRHSSLMHSCTHSIPSKPSLPHYSVLIKTYSCPATTLFKILQWLLHYLQSKTQICYRRSFMISANGYFSTPTIQNILVAHDYISLFPVSGQSRPCPGSPKLNQWILCPRTFGLEGRERQREREEQRERERRRERGKDQLDHLW